MSCCLPVSPNSILEVVLKIQDCDKCEKIIIDAIHKFKGVDEWYMSYERATKTRKIVVKGVFNLEKLVKHIKTETDMEVEILMKKVKSADSEVVQKSGKKSRAEDDEKAKLMITKRKSDERKEMEKVMMLAQETPKFMCSIS